MEKDKPKRADQSKETGVMTTSSGMEIDDNHNSITAGQYGPVVIGDLHFLDKIGHFDRQRIPQRVVHAKGTGAHGYFKVTHDVTKYTKAKVFEAIGKTTPIFARFSTVAGEKGTADTRRDPRGFAIKFYTEVGNWDMVGNNTPVFFVRDPLKFIDFIHTQKRDPKTNLFCPRNMWDFWSLMPESSHQVMILFTDRGTPDGFRHMHGFGSHTFRWVNAKGEAFWVKFHFKTKSEIKNLTNDQAKQLEGKNPDYAQEDLVQHLQAGKTAEWGLFVQVMPEADALNYKWNIFDVTKVISQKDYPLIPVGEMVLDRNVENYFAETEQAAFSPANMIPGIEPSPDKMLQGRLLSYADTHRHRLGPNFIQIPVNCPYKARVHNGLRDGLMCVNGNQASKPNFEPNSYGTFKFNSDAKMSSYKVTGMVGRFKPSHPNDDFKQPGDLFRLVDPEMKKHIVSNITGHMKDVPRQIQERAVKNFYRCDPNLGDQLAKVLGFPSVKSRL